jgi:hypothetical protein
MDKYQREAIDNGIENLVDSLETTMLPAMKRIATAQFGDSDDDEKNEIILKSLEDYAKSVIQKKLAEAEAEIRLALMKL